MAFSYAYPYPLPNPYVTTYVDRTFPEHHWPLEQTRHKLSDALHDIVHPVEMPIRTPHADVRESLANYYVDVELPGLENKENISLKWTSSRTLLVHATITRPSVPEEERGPTVQATEDTQGRGGDAKAVKTEGGEGAQKQPEHPVHLTVRERRIGTFERAFDFAMDVDHDAVDAHLRFGLLRITVRKQEEEKRQLKEVEIAHHGS